MSQVVHVSSQRLSVCRAFRAFTDVIASHPAVWESGPMGKWIIVKVDQREMDQLKWINNAMVDVKVDQRKSGSM